MIKSRIGKLLCGWVLAGTAMLHSTYEGDPEYKKFLLERYERKRQEAAKDWDQLRAIAENIKPIRLSDAVRELITGITGPYFDEELVKKIAEMEKQVASGEYVEKWDNGKRKFRGAFKKGVAEGHIHGWYPDGSDAFKGYFTDGLKQGIHMAFFPKEEKEMDGETYHFGRLLTYREDGKAHGRQLANSSDRKSQVFAKYKNGVISEEPVTFYWKELIEERVYKKGKLVSAKKIEPKDL
jgi:hypothetical protein